VVCREVSRMQMNISMGIYWLNMRGILHDKLMLVRLACKRQGLDALVVSVFYE
jgi:hypothetical protein